MIDTKILYSFVPKKQCLSYEEFVQEINELIDRKKDSVFDSYATQYRVDCKVLSDEQWDLKTCNQEARKFLATHWTTLDNKLSIVGGKEFLSCMFTHFKDKYNVSLSKQKIIQSFTPETLPIEIKDFLTQLN